MAFSYFSASRYVLFLSECPVCVSLLMYWEFVEDEDEVLEWEGFDIDSAFSSLVVGGGCKEIDEVEGADELGAVFGNLRDALVFSARRHCEPGICIAAA